MARKMVALRPAQKKGSAGPVTEPPKGLTLADITVTRRSLNEVMTVTGPELAQLLRATRPTADVFPAFVSPGALADELDSLADIVQVIGAADYHDSGLPLDKSLSWIGECLRRLATRAAALHQGGTSAPNWYAVEVTK